MPSTARLGWIDAAKGIGIILVVIGHTVSGTLKDIIFLFHMPLFFILTGYLFRHGPPGQFALRRFQSLLIPYFSYMVLVALADIVLAKFSGVPPIIDMADPAKSAARLILGGSFLYASLGAFWFLTCLYLASLFYNVSARHFAPISPQAIAIALFCTGLSYTLSAVIPSGARIPLGLPQVPLAVALLWLGHAANTALSGMGSQFWRISLLTMAFAVFCLGAIYAPPFDMKPLILGNPLINLPVAVAGTLIVCGAAALTCRLPVLAPLLQYLGRASLVIMCLHLLIITHLRLDAVPTIFIATLVPVAFYAIALRSRQLRKFFLGQS